MIRECCHDFRHQPLSSATLYKELENFNILIVQKFVYTPSVTLIEMCLQKLI